MLAASHVADNPLPLSVQIRVYLFPYIYICIYSYAGLFCDNLLDNTNTVDPNSAEPTSTTAPPHHHARCLRSVPAGTELPVRPLQKFDFFLSFPTRTLNKPDSSHLSSPLESFFPPTIDLLWNFTAASFSSLWTRRLAGPTALLPTRRHGNRTRSKSPFHFTIAPRNDASAHIFNSGFSFSMAVD